MGVRVAEFVRVYPHLFHMAEADAWPSIREHGLCSAVRLVAEYGADERHVTARRPRAVTLDAPGRAPVVLRDNGVLSDAMLARCLVGTDLPGYYRLLNERVYLWPTRERVERLLDAAAYRDRAHLVLTFDTAKVLAAHGPDVRLCPLNFGATVRTAPPRGPDSLHTLADFPWRARRRTAGRGAVAEVSVLDAIPDVEPLLVDVAVRRAERRARP